MKGKIIEIIVDGEIKGKIRMTDLKSKFDETHVESDRSEFALNKGDWGICMEKLEEIIHRKAERLYKGKKIEYNTYDVKVSQ